MSAGQSSHELSEADELLAGGSNSETHPRLGGDGALGDLNLEGLSLYEKKSELINREMNSMGMGRYQVWSMARFIWHILRGAELLRDVSNPTSLELSSST